MKKTTGFTQKYFFPCARGLLYGTALLAGATLAYASTIEPKDDGVCDFTKIYNDRFSYSLPKTVLESFLLGKSFDNKEAYTPEELEKLKRDINRVYSECISGNPVKSNVFVVTAGAPGAGKTLLMRQELVREKALGNKFAYMDPDDVCGRGFQETFQADLGENPSKEHRAAVYTHWRPGTNAGAHFALANLIRDRYAVYFGSTSTAPQTKLFFEFLKNQGRTIKILHVSAPDDVRWRSIQKRDETFVQTTEEDTREKGLLFPQRINDTYLKYANEIAFYYRGEVDDTAIHAATWVQNLNGTGGVLQIFDEEAYAEIQKIHNAGCKALKRDDLVWEESVLKNTTIVETSKR